MSAGLRQAVAEGGGDLGVDHGVVLAVVLATLGVAGEDVAAAELGEHRPADVAGEGAGVVGREVLRAVLEQQAVAVDQRLDAAYVDERGQHDGLDRGELFLVEAERDLLGECDGLEVVQVHLPVAGDERRAGDGGHSDLFQDGHAGQRLALEEFQRRTAASGDVAERVDVQAQGPHGGG
jgi:hypothetical protein